MTTPFKILDESNLLSSRKPALGVPLKTLTSTNNGKGLSFNPNTNTNRKALSTVTDSQINTRKTPAAKRTLTFEKSDLGSKSSFRIETKESSTVSAPLTLDEFDPADTICGRLTKDEDPYHMVMRMSNDPNRVPFASLSDIPTEKFDPREFDEPPVDFGFDDASFQDLLSSFTAFNSED